MEKPIKTPEEFIAEELGIPVSKMGVDEIKKRKEKKDNVVETSFLETPEYILEQIGSADYADDAVCKRELGKPSFVKFSRLNGEIDIVNEFEYKGVVYRPIVDDILLKGGIMLPTGVEEYKNTKEITDQIYEYITERIQVPQNPVNYERFLPNLILFYWLYDKFPFVPYIHFVGGTGTGKTTAMETIGSLSYKPIDSSGSLTIASMFRMATAWRGTLLIDEFEKVGEDTKSIILFLKAGVSNRLVLRTEGDKIKKLTAYIIKSPKIFTSEKPMDDAGLLSRTITIKMEKNTKRLPLYQLREDYKEAEDIRNKLLLWRLHNYDNISLKDIKYGFPELEVFDRRVQQILTPIYFFSDEEKRKDILQFAKEQEEETLRERRESLEGSIFEMMLEIWNDGDEVQLKSLTSRLNEDRKSGGYRSELTEKKVANIIRKVLGFDIEQRGHDKARWIVMNCENLESKASYFGINLALYDTLYSSLFDTAQSATSAGNREKILPEKNLILEANEIFNEE
jgi:hypothetical protein